MDGPEAINQSPHYLPQYHTHLLPITSVWAIIRPTRVIIVDTTTNDSISPHLTKKTSAYIKRNASSSNLLFIKPCEFKI